MSDVPKTLLIFVDGLGLGSADPAVNPIHSGVCPCLEELLTRAAPVDATLGVAGMPQSATGQTTLLTGVNAARVMGRHVEALPGPKLREVIVAHNVFSQLAVRGYRGTFANGYFVDDVKEVLERRRQSVTTVASLAGLGSVRDTEDMLCNWAVYQDLTRETLRPRGYDGPLVTPCEAAGHLLAIAREYDFTLFEFFLTDVAAHKGSRDAQLEILKKLDEFLDVVRGHADIPRGLFVLTSDHGNMEDSTTRLHTLNPVPLVAIGQGATELRTAVKSLVDFVPALLTLYPPR